MQINLGEEQMRAVVSKAILESLGDEQKTLILTQAVEHLMKAPDDNRGYPYNQDKRNYLQRAFDAASERALGKIADEEMQKPENIEKIRALLGPVLEAALSKSEAWDNMRKALAEAITRAFENQRRD